MAKGALRCKSDFCQYVFKFSQHIAMTVRPPLNALHAFCLVVRAGGIRQAANALNVSPGAVTRQVQVLEQHLAVKLFERGAGSTSTLTTAGRRLYNRIGEQMAVIEEALDGTSRAARRATIVVDTGVTLAMHWLIPRLRAFSERHPRIRVQVQTADGDVDPGSPADVFIRRGVSELRDLPSHVLITERSVLVASPSFIADMPGQRPRDMRWLAKAPRIGTRSRVDLWPRWCAFHGLNQDALEPTLEFDNTVLAIQAAIQGLGVCVVPEMFVATMVSGGMLGMLHPARVETGSYSYAIGRRRDSARVNVFIAWLRSLAADPAAMDVAAVDRLAFEGASGVRSPGRSRAQRP
ncbi:LysR family transcriptional regulator [Paraburkholderia sp. Se-20369]|nr:LysR family transcriptional regulator [Paraburkholderia sp. Se-20369]